jgi:hypothetical protein
MAKYSKKLAGQVATLVGEGVPAKHAAAAFGIGESTFYEWRGKHPEFSELLEQKRAEAVRARVSLIQQAAEKGNWQSAAWWLERQCPEEFALKVKTVQAKTGEIEPGYEERLRLVQLNFQRGRGEGEPENDAARIR